MSEVLFTPEISLDIYNTFIAQGVSKVYAAICCGRLYMGIVPASRCRTCQGSPKAIEIDSSEDLAKITDNP